MTSKKILEQLEPFEARTIIEALRKGSVPTDYVSFFTVGRENWLTFIEDDLEHYIAEGGAKVRFISGDYGDGKTHFMSVIRHLSLQQGFAVSFVVLTREVPIHKFEIVYQSIVNQLMGTFEQNGIRNLMENWMNNPSFEQTEEDKFSIEELISKTSENIRALSGMDINFANALIALLNNRLMPLKEGETQEERNAGIDILYRWLEGNKVAKKDLKPFQIFEVLNKTNSKQFLSSLIAFLRYLGYKGLILLMDELETVIAQAASVRNAAYENVRLLIDNTEQAEYLHIFFSIIPDVLASEKGFKSYDALWSRVRSVGESSRLNYRGVLINLHQTPLKEKELISLGICLRRIHEISYRWQAGDLIKDDLIEEICMNQKRMGLLNEVRLFVKQIVRLLDMAEQGKSPEDLDLTEHVLTSQREIKQEKIEHLQPSWDT